MFTDLNGPKRRTHNFIDRAGHVPFAPRFASVGGGQPVYLLTTHCSAMKSSLDRQWEIKAERIYESHSAPA
jgi:hypothetical protein